MSSLGSGASESNTSQKETYEERWLKAKSLLESYKRESRAANNALGKSIIFMSRIIQNEEVPDQIKRIAKEVLETRDLATQHRDQINYLESWLHAYGINLYNPPPAPRRPPMKRRRESESPNHMSEWLQVKTEEGEETCVDCSVRIPDTYNQMVATIAKRTRRSVSDIINNFQFVDPSTPQATPDHVYEPPEIETTEHDPVVKPETEEGEILSQPTDEPVNTEQNEEKSEEIVHREKEPRRCAANFDNKPKGVSKPEENLEEEKELDPQPTNPILEIIEFMYDKEDKGQLMHRITFRICDFFDAVPKRIFMDPWIDPSYSGEEIIVKRRASAEKDTIRNVERVFVSQPWRQFRNYPFYYTEEVDIKFILPSGRTIVAPFGFIKSQVKSTSVGSNFMKQFNVSVRLNINTGKGIVNIDGDNLDCCLIRSGPVRPGAPWVPRDPLRNDQSLPIGGGGYAQRRLESLQEELKSKVEDRGQE